MRLMCEAGHTPQTDRAVPFELGKPCQVKVGVLRANGTRPDWCGQRGHDGRRHRVFDQDDGFPSPPFPPTMALRGGPGNSDLTTQAGPAIAGNKSPHTLGRGRPRKSAKEKRANKTAYERERRRSRG